MNGLKHEETTKEIIGCAFDILNELGSGFLESVYERAMIRALHDKKLPVVSQHPIQVFFRDECVGEFYADLLVDEKVIVELKAIKAIAPEPSGSDHQLSQCYRRRSWSPHQLRKSQTRIQAIHP